MKEIDLSVIGAQMATTPTGETRIINMPPSEVVRNGPIPRQETVFEADRENPFGNEGRGFFDPEESEGRYE